jgi:hypothetical protein
VAEPFGQRRRLTKYHSNLHHVLPPDCQKALEAFTLNGMSSNLQIYGLKGRSFSPSTQIYPPVDGCLVGWPSGGPCGFPGAKMAGSFYSQWNELKLADIGHQRVLAFPLYSDLSPRGWLSCGVAQRGALWLPRGKNGWKLLLSME